MSRFIIWIVVLLWHTYTACFVISEAPVSALWYTNNWNVILNVKFSIDFNCRLLLSCISMKVTLNFTVNIEHVRFFHYVFLQQIVELHYLLICFFLSFSFILTNKPNHIQQNVVLHVLHRGDFNGRLAQKFSHPHSSAEESFSDEPRKNFKFQSNLQINKKYIKYNICNP